MVSLIEKKSKENTTKTLNKYITGMLAKIEIVCPRVKEHRRVETTSRNIAEMKKYTSVNGIIKR